MDARIGGLALLALALGSDSHADEPRLRDPMRARERTSFQTHARWAPDLQLGSDVAICYGIDASLPERITGWKNQGYIPHLMTGVSWGEYQDYLYGRFDGVNHEDEAQTERSGKKISHGRDVYYMSPGKDYGTFLAEGVKKAIAAGAEAVHLEEPEFWVRAGYSPGFQREWRDFYHEDWIAPHTSPDAQYRASLLKYHLYRRALKQVFDVVKAESARLGRPIPCYVPTHSLLNYAHWNIISPESSLIEVGADGFIAQVWTGTARTPNVYGGQKRERTFETAFLEYGAMQNMVRSLGKTVWFLNDPIEDNPNHSWRDYQANWESTLVASLLWPGVHKYEVMPWPERIWRGRYPTQEQADRKPGVRVERAPIPPAYATELLTVINVLNDMDQPDGGWVSAGTRGLGVIVSDSMMFQRGEPNPSDPDLSSFYGLAMPLLKHGMPVEPVQLENVVIPGALDPHKVLFLTYEGMKPLTPEVHSALAAWVRQGGVLIYVGDDADPYNLVRSWWNDKSKGMTYQTPRVHLFEQLGLPTVALPGEHPVGKGYLIWDTTRPATLTTTFVGANQVTKLVERATELVDASYEIRNHLILRRGPYLVGAGLDETVESPLANLPSRFVDLFDANLAIVQNVKFGPGSRRLLLDIEKANPTGEPKVLAAAARVTDPKFAAGEFSFHAEGPNQTEAVVRVAFPRAPVTLTATGPPELAAPAMTWDEASKTVLIRFANAASGRRIAIR